MTIRQNKLLATVPPMNCSICNERNSTVIREAYDDRYGQPDIFQLVRCDQCGHEMTFPRITESELGELYSTYYPRKYVNLTELQQEAILVAKPFARLKRWWNGTDNQGHYRVSRGQIMLDVGCGNGLSLLEAKHLGAKTYGIEADPNVFRIANELGLNIHIGSLHDNPFPDISFDLIVLNQVIEHIPEPGEALEVLKQRLKPSGRLVLAFPNRCSFWQKLFGPKWINWHIPYHLHHFNKKGFRALAQRHGYRLIRQKTITPNIWTVLQLQALQLSPVAGVPSNMWPSGEDVDIYPAGATRQNSSPIFRKLLKQIVLFNFGLFNRIIDLVGQGDSILVELGIEDVQ